MKTDKSDLGAPAALSRLERQERDLELEMMSCKAAWEGLKCVKDAVDTEALNGQIAAAKATFDDALKRWREIATTLLNYEKNIAPSKREGEKISASDAREMMIQLLLSIDLSIESYIISQAGSSVMVSTQEEFYKLHAINLRACKESAIKRAKETGVLPEWL